MKIEKDIITKNFRYKLTIESSTVPSHAIYDDYRNVFATIVDDVAGRFESQIKTLETIIETSKNRKY